MRAHAEATARAATAAETASHTLAAAAETTAASQAVAAHAVPASASGVTLRGLDVCDRSEGEAHRREPCAQKSDA